MWEHLKNKKVKIVLKIGNKIRVLYGVLVDGNQNFIVEKDPKGRVHFLKTANIERISEIREANAENSII